MLRNLTASKSRPYLANVAIECAVITTAGPLRYGGLGRQDSSAKTQLLCRASAADERALDATAGPTKLGKILEGSTPRQGHRASAASGNAVFAIAGQPYQCQWTCYLPRHILIAGKSNQF